MITSNLDLMTEVGEAHIRTGRKGHCSTAMQPLKAVKDNTYGMSWYSNDIQNLG